jgi:hypothetical protein
VQALQLASKLQAVAQTSADADDALMRDATSPTSASATQAHERRRRAATDEIETGEHDANDVRVLACCGGSA